jgi:hypothetical protein
MHPLAALEHPLLEGDLSSIAASAPQILPRLSSPGTARVNARVEVE